MHEGRTKVRSLGRRLLENPPPSCPEEPQGPNGSGFLGARVSLGLKGWPWLKPLPKVNYTAVGSGHLWEECRPKGPTECSLGWHWGGTQVEPWRWEKGLIR